MNSNRNLSSPRSRSGKGRISAIVGACTLSAQALSMGASFFLAVAPATAFAQTDRDIEASVQRANSYLDQVEKKLDRIKPTTSENSIRGIQRKLIVRRGKSIKSRMAQRARRRLSVG